MKLECQKYGEKVEAEKAFCRHPDDYCRYRSSCMIQFIGKENRRAQEPTDKAHPSTPVKTR